MKVDATSVTEDSITLRRCDHGHCHNWFVPVSDSHRFCDDKCRAAQWKIDNHYGRRQIPSERRTNASGLQVSFRRAVEVISHGLYANPKVVEEVLARGLSERQRARWEARQ